MGRKIIIPEKLQSKVLEELHTGQPGVIRMKSVSRVHVLWPRIDKNIDGKELCNLSKYQNKPSLTSLHSSNWPSQPWHCLHLNLFGPFVTYVIIDA